jgi:hypothetical protein
MAAKTPEHPTLVALRRNRRRYALAEQRLAELQRERRQLYIEARQTDPPLTFLQVATAAGVTQAAVHQVVNKARAANGSL